jgi:hypothetical protein
MHAPLRSGSRRASTRRISDAVIANYVHDISQRHRARQGTRRTATGSRPHATAIERPTVKTETTSRIA